MRRWLMDILGSMLAYLGCVAGIVGALVISFIVYFSPPAHSTNIKHAIAMVARPSVAKADQRTHIVTIVAQSTTTPQTATAPPPTAVAASARPKAQSSRAQAMRRLVEEERAKRWAYQQDPDFETRFLGYAD